MNHSDFREGVAKVTLEAKKTLSQGEIYGPAPVNIQISLRSMRNIILDRYIGGGHSVMVILRIKSGSREGPMSIGLNFEYCLQASGKDENFEYCLQASGKDENL
ncbi:hypothetical protein ACLOJK_028068 [Asimina triloba]